MFLSQYLGFCKENGKSYINQKILFDCDSEQYPQYEQNKKIYGLLYNYQKLDDTDIKNFMDHFYELQSQYDLTNTNHISEIIYTNKNNVYKNDNIRKQL